jgi:hypothetical protein
MVPATRRAARLDAGGDGEPGDAVRDRDAATDSSFCEEGEVALYLVVHAPKSEQSNMVHPPTRLRELAESSATGLQSPRWLKAWSPDLHDDRIFTLWEAASAVEVQAALEEFGFLNDMDATPLRVREWGPDDVLSAGE